MSWTRTFSAWWITAALCCLGTLPVFAMKNFKVAVYARAYEVREMGDLSWLKPRWEEISRQVEVDKVYLETHRDLILVDKETLQRAKDFFHERGIETAGGITLTVNERNRFETFCYSNPEHREKVREIAVHTARLFDEVILDDFFFTSCKCKLCIQAKGERSWTQYRLQLLTEAAENLILRPVREANPKAIVVVKYPNWYEHFQGLGFNLETEPPLFDGLYTGTETRDAVRSAQHLQQYHGYSIFRYFENLKPGANRGGWVDTYGSSTLDRYAEQLWLTVFAKAPEVTLFDFLQLTRPLGAVPPAPWNGQGTSFDYAEMLKPIQLEDGTSVTPTTMARAAGFSLELVDGLVGSLGNPVGIKSYKPFHSVGEDFLHSYLGMIGIPVELVPEFPEDEVVLLTETAAFDREIVDKIRLHLSAGKKVVITSGFLRALEGGIDEIVELRYTDRKALVSDFLAGWGQISSTEDKILIPQIQYLTNDSWELVSGLAGPNGYPLLHLAEYGGGTLLLLTVPDNFADFYRYPETALNAIRQNILTDVPVVLEGPGLVSLFLYDNDTFIVESFRDETVDCRVVLEGDGVLLVELLSGKELSGQKRPAPRFGPPASAKTLFDLQIQPHSFQAFQKK